MDGSEVAAVILERLSLAPDPAGGADRSARLDEAVAALIACGSVDLGPGTVATAADVTLSMRLEERFADVWLYDEDPAASPDVRDVEASLQALGPDGVRAADLLVAVAGAACSAGDDVPAPVADLAARDEPPTPGMAPTSLSRARSRHGWSEQDAVRAGVVLLSALPPAGGDSP